MTVSPIPLQPPTSPPWVPDPTSSVFGAKPSQNLALSSSGVEWRLANGISFMVKADSEWGDRSHTYSGTGRIRYTW